MSVTTTIIIGYFTEFLKSHNVDESVLTDWENKKVEVTSLLKKTKSKTRASKDPNRPKKMNAYAIFCKEKGKDYKSEDLFKELGKSWKKLSTKSRDEYKEKAKKMAEEYEKKMKDYVPPPLPPKKPILPRSAGIWFRKQIKEAQKKGDFDDDFDISEAWKEIKSEDGEKYEQYKQMASDDKLRYENEWTEFDAEWNEYAKQAKAKGTKIEEMPNKGRKKSGKGGKKKAKKLKLCVSPSGCFKAERRAELKDQSIDEINDILKKEWNEIKKNEDRYTKYKEMAANNKETMKKQMESDSDADMGSDSD